MAGHLGDIGGGVTIGDAALTLTAAKQNESGAGITSRIEISEYADIMSQKHYLYFVFQRGPRASGLSLSTQMALVKS